VWRCLVRGWRGETSRHAVEVAVVLAFCVAVSSCAAPAALATPPATETVAPNAFNVVVLGDSIAAGTGATGDSTRWWIRVQTALRAALPERSIVVKNSARAGSGLDYLERTAATVSPIAFQAAVIIEGRNDQVDDGSWLSRYTAVVTGLEAKGIVVVIGTYPPTLSAGAFVPTGRTGVIRTLAGPKRPLLDFEQRWLQAGPTMSVAWYADEVHANDDGQAIEAEVAVAVLLPLGR
jgi:lysophospholipase L1-like esterase